MGYELHVTRAGDWAENDASQISPEEWTKLVESDPELQFDTRNGPYFAVWAGHVEHPQSWFDWSEGNIHTKSPDRPTLGKMLQLAQRLGAKVQGDDGEVYESVDDHPGPAPQVQAGLPADRGMPAYARRERLWNLLVYASIAVVIVTAIFLDLW